MGRKNSNAGQPNRIAQSNRRAERKTISAKFHHVDHHRTRLVMGPLSENLSPQPAKTEVLTRVINPSVREKVAA